MRQPPLVFFRTIVSVVRRSTFLPSYVPVVRPCVSTQATAPCPAERRLVIVSVIPWL